MVLLLLSFTVSLSEALRKGKLENDFAPVPENVLAMFPSEACGDSVFIEWAPPSQDFLIQSYLVMCESQNLDDRVVNLVDGDTRQAVLGPLKIDSMYRCSVASRTKLHGTSEPAYTESFSTET